MDSIKELQVLRETDESVLIRLKITAGDKKDYQLSVDADYNGVSRDIGSFKLIEEASETNKKAGPSLTTATHSVDAQSMATSASSELKLPVVLMYYKPGMGFIKEGTPAYFVNDSGQLSNQKSALTTEQIKTYTIVVLQTNKDKTVVRGWAFVPPKGGRKMLLFPMFDSDFVSYPFKLGLPSEEKPGAKTLKIICGIFCYPIAIALDIAGGVAL